MGRTVLVVEDEALIRFVAAEFLQDQGFQVLEAGCALEAIGILSNHPDIDVVFTDVDMPGGPNGVDLARLVENLYPGIGILVTSGRFYLQEADLPSGSRFLDKPYRLAALAETVEDLASEPIRRASH